MDEIESMVAEIKMKLSALEDYLGIEWYDVPLRERYIKKEPE